MNKVESWLVRSTVVIYGLACLLAMMNDNKIKNDMESNICKTCAGTQQIVGKLVWLKDMQFKGEDASPDDYDITETKALTANQLKVIIAPDNYRKQGDFVALAEFAPIAQVRYANEKGEEEVLVFSFVSCEYKKYVCGKLVDSGLLDNPDGLSDYLEAIR